MIDQPTKLENQLLWKEITQEHYNAETEVRSSRRSNKQKKKDGEISKAEIKRYIRRDREFQRKRQRWYGWKYIKLLFILRLSIIYTK